MISNDSTAKSGENEVYLTIFQLAVPLGTDLFFFLPGGFSIGEFTSAEASAAFPGSDFPCCELSAFTCSFPAPRDEAPQSKQLELAGILSS